MCDQDWELTLRKIAELLAHPLSAEERSRFDAKRLAVEDLMTRDVSESLLRRAMSRVANPQSNVKETLDKVRPEAMVMLYREASKRLSIQTSEEGRKKYIDALDRIRERWKLQGEGSLDEGTFGNPHHE